MTKTPKLPKKGGLTERGGKISLYGLSVEDALRAAAKTGRPPPLRLGEAESATEETDETGLVVEISRLMHLGAAHVDATTISFPSP